MPRMRVERRCRAMLLLLRRQLPLAYSVMCYLCRVYMMLVDAASTLL